MLPTRTNSKGTGPSGLWEWSGWDVGCRREGTARRRKYHLGNGWSHLDNTYLALHPLEELVMRKITDSERLLTVLKGKLDKTKR